MYPATVNVSAFQERLTLCCGALAPVPVAETVGELVALLPKEITPDAAPVACGLKVTVNDVFCPAARVKGNDRPLSENSALFDAADVTVTLAALAVRVPVWLLPVPTVTLPKLRVVGETDSCPWLEPVPDKGTLKVEFEAFEITVRLPLALPPDWGAKVTVSVRL